MSFLDPIGGVIGDIAGDANPFKVFEGVGDFFKNTIELMVMLVKNIGPLFDFLFFMINNTIDVVYGSLALINGLGKEFAELMPHLSKIIDQTLEAVDFLLDFYKDNSNLLVAAVMLIPAYGMLYLLIRQLNNIF